MATKSDVPKVQDLIVPTVRALSSMGGSGTLQEINDTVAELLRLPEEVQLLPKGDSSDTWFGYRCRWARSYLKLDGLADNSERGVWALTPAGQSASAHQLAGVWARVHALVAARRKDVSSVTSTDDEEVEDISAPQMKARDWHERLLEILKLMEPDAFERLCQRVLRESGFSKVEVTGRSGDGGIDGVGVLRLNLISFQTLFQCKRYKDAVGAAVIRDFRGAMIGRADKGLVMTTGRFTSDAQREATRDGAPPIELIDGNELCHLLRSLRLGVSVKTVEVEEIEEPFFSSI